MDANYLEQIHHNLCGLHNDLSAKIVEMPDTDPLYRAANETADRIYAAAQSAYKLFRYASEPVEQ